MVPLHPLKLWPRCPPYTHSPIAPPYKIMAPLLPPPTKSCCPFPPQTTAPWHPLLELRPLCTRTEPSPFSPPTHGRFAPPDPQPLCTPCPSRKLHNLGPSLQAPFSPFSPQLPPPQLLRLFPPDAGGAPLPWAGLEPPAAPGQAGVCRVPGGRIPPPAPLHRTWAARSQVGGNRGGGNISEGTCPTSLRRSISPCP